MKLKMLLLTLFCAGLNFAAVAAPAPAPAPGSPAAVATEWFRAIVRGDQKTAESLCVGANVKEEVAKGIEQMKAMKAEAQKDPKNAILWKAFENITFANGKITGDRAVVYMVLHIEVNGEKLEQVNKDNPLELLKVDGKWKVNADKM